MEDGRCMDSMALVTAKQYGIDDNILARAQTLSIQFDKLCRSQDDLGSASAHINVAKVGNADDGGSGSISNSDSEESNKDTIGKRYNLNVDVAPIVRSVCGDGNVQVHIIPAGWDSPVSLEGQSCVYVLQLYHLSKVIQIAIHLCHLMVNFKSSFFVVFSKMAHLKLFDLCILIASHYPHVMPGFSS